jgi:Beta-lactamase enzyme family
VLRSYSVSRAALVTGLAVALSAGPAVSTQTAARAAVSGPARATGALAQAARTLAVAGAASAPICTSAAHPAVAGRISRGIRIAMRGRSSIVGVTADDRIKGVTCAFQQDRRFYSASVVKATILAALLRKLLVRHQFLTKAQAALATKMITVSDNNAASALWAQVGRVSMQRFLNLAKMKQTLLGPGGAWGLTQITAHDELLLLKLLTSKNSVLDLASRNYELSLMARVIPSERWGVPAGAPAGVTVHVKNGWLPYPVSNDWHINSIGSFSGHGHDYMIVVLTTRNPTMAYGVDTVQRIAEVINRGLNPGVTNVVPASAPFPSWGISDEQLPAPGHS